MECNPALAFVNQVLKSPSKYIFHKIKIISVHYLSETLKAS